MAFISNPNEDDELKKQQGGVSTSGIVGTAASGGPTASGSGGDATKAPTSTGFVNLQSYLDANQGSGGKLAGEATKDLSNQVNTFGQTAASTAAGSKSAFDAANGNDKASNIKGGLASDANGTYGQATNFLGSTYGGPQTSDYTGQLATQQTNLNNNLGQVDNQAKQQDLLKQTYGGGGQQYTNGFGQLDSFLINGSEDGRGTIAGVKAKTGDVNNSYNDAVGKIMGYQTDAQKQFAANQAGVRSTARDLFSAKDQGFNQQVAQKNAGLNRSNIGVNDYGLGDVTSDKDRLDLHALASLAGENYDEGKYKRGGGSEGTAQQPSQAPTINQHPLASSDGRSLGEVTGFAPITAAGGAISDATKKAGADIANSVKQPSSPVLNVSNLPQNIINYAAPRVKTPKFGR